MCTVGCLGMPKKEKNREWISFCRSCCLILLWYLKINTFSIRERKERGVKKKEEVKILQTGRRI